MWRRGNNAGRGGQETTIEERAGRWNGRFEVGWGEKRGGLGVRLGEIIWVKLAGPIPSPVSRASCPKIFWKASLPAERASDAVPPAWLVLGARWQRSGALFAGAAFCRNVRCSYTGN